MAKSRSLIAVKAKLTKNVQSCTLLPIFA